jgi:hypothetical protein
MRCDFFTGYNRDDSSHSLRLGRIDMFDSRVRVMLRATAMWSMPGSTTSST